LCMGLLSPPEGELIGSAPAGLFIEMSDSSEN